MISPAPAQTAPHFVVVVTEEQIKVIVFCNRYLLEDVESLDSTTTIVKDKEEGKN